MSGVTYFASMLKMKAYLLLKMRQKVQNAVAYANPLSPN